MRSNSLNLSPPKPGEKLCSDNCAMNPAIWITMAASIITIILSLPFIKWFRIINADALYKSFKLLPNAISKLAPKYSIYNILSFVYETRQGSIGLYAMLLLLLMAATLFMHGLFIFRIFKKKKYTPGNLSVYFAAKCAAVFTFMLSTGSIGYISFSNDRFDMEGFALSPAVYIIMFLSIISYIVIKLADVKERIFYNEPGFFTEFRRNWVLFIMLIPTFVFFMINAYLPMLGVYFGFTAFNFRDGLWASPFVGFKNFEHLFKADLFKLTRNTILYNLVFIGVGNVLQVIYAIFVSHISKKWFKRLSQTLMFMPYFVSYVILKVLVYNLFQYETGAINSLLVSLGLERLDFYNTPAYWPFLITLFYIWKNLGYGMVVYLATITGISDEYYEAAKIDGANIFQQIRYITLPLVKPTFIILLLYALGSIMKGQFELFYQLIGNNGLLYNITDIFDTYVYRISTTQPLNIGIGTAAGLYQAIFGFVVIMVTNYFVKKRNEDFALF
jgi:ABC-type polysaccharide transport system permease subunit